MALTKIKLFVAGDILLASELNAEYANIYNSGEDLCTPATKAHRMDGFELTLDADLDTGILADTNDRIDMRIQAVDLFRFDGTVGSPVNGLDFIAAVTSGDVEILGTGTNPSVKITSAGTGTLKLNGATAVTGALSCTGDLTVSGDYDSNMVLTNILFGGF